MPYMFITAHFPSNMAKAVGSTYLEERKKFPRDRSLGKVVVEAVKPRENGIETIGILQIKEGKLEAALKRQQDASALYHDIEGYEYSIDIYWNAAEALGVIGMEPPADD